MKEKEISAIAAKIEDEQSLGSKMQKQVTQLTTPFAIEDIRRAPPNYVKTGGNDSKSMGEMKQNGEFPHQQNAPSQ